MPCGKVDKLYTSVDDTPTRYRVREMSDPRYIVVTRRKPRGSSKAILWAFHPRFSAPTRGFPRAAPAVRTPDEAGIAVQRERHVERERKWQSLL